MKTCIIALSIALLTTVESAQGDDAVETSYSQLRRLQNAMALPSFPTPSQDGIQTWKQESDSGAMVNKFDFTKFPLNNYHEFHLDSIVKFYGGHAMSNDLANVVIISNNGCSIRFVDVDRRVEKIAIKRGDVVAFLLSEKSK